MSLSNYRKIIFKTDTRNCEEHPLHVCCDQVKWMTTFGKHESPCIVALCHDKDRLFYKKRLFVTLHLRNVAVDSNHDNESPLTIITNPYFHNHYKIDVQSSEHYITTIKTFPLKEIVFGTTNAETFLWSKEKKFESGLTVTGTCMQSVLVRNGDEFLAPLHTMFGDKKSEVLQYFRDLITLETSPLDQGVININTTVTVVKLSEVESETTVKECYSINRDFEFTIDLLRSHHVQLLHEEFDESTDVIITRIAAETIGLESDQVYNIVVNVKNEENQENEYLSIDMYSNYQGKVRQRPVNIIVLDDLVFDNNTVYISRLLWLNFVSTVMGNETHKCRLLPTLDVPPSASEIHVSLIISPQYAANIEYDKCLLRYLKTPRILCVGDIFVVDVEGDHEFYSIAAPQDMCSCNKIFYKVMKFGPKETEDGITCCNVSMRDTNLYQNGTVNSYIPSLVSELSKFEGNGLQSYVDKLSDIILPYVDDPYNTHIPTVLLSGPESCGKNTILSCVANRMNMHIIDINCYELVSDSSGAMEGKITTAMQKAATYLPCIIMLKNIDCVGWDKDGEKVDHRVCSSFIKIFERMKLKDGMACLVIGVTSNKHNVVPNLRPFFIHQIEIEPMTDSNRKQILESIARHLNYKRIYLDEVGFIYGDLWELMQRSLVNAKDRIVKECSIGSKLSWKEQESIGAAGISASEKDILKTLKQMQKEQAKIFGMPKVPSVKWDNIGGLEEAKKHIKDTIQLPLDHPELAVTGLCRSGVLLYGPPGTGKTLLAKAVATECSLNFLSVKGPELINMYVGQSEENVRQVFARAREGAPCVIFFDELDSLAPNRGRSGDSGGVMDRVVSQLLAELDGMQGERDVHKHVFAIGATNRPDLVDPALLRPGRFDKMIYVSVNKNKKDNLKVLQAQMRNINLGNDVDLEEVVQRCPDNMTGADFYALTSSAVMNAIRKKIMIIEAQSDIGGKNDKVEVTQQDLINAALNITPSLSAQELRNYEKIQSNIDEK